MDNPKTAFRNNFQIIRIFAAVMVVYGHMCPLSGNPFYLFGNTAVSTLGVKLLFVISGYLITKSYWKDSHFGRYFLKRCFRIFPALIGVVFLTVFLLGPLVTSLTAKEYFTNPQTWSYFWNIALKPVYGLPGVFGENVYPNAVNGSLWTLPVEFLMYLLIPAVCVVLKKMKHPEVGMFGFFLVFLTLNVCRFLFFSDYRMVIYGSNLPDSFELLPYYFMGSTLSFPMKKIKFNLQISLFLAIAGLCFSLPGVVSKVLDPIVLPYCVLSFALAESPVFEKFLAKTDLTYGIYLYGFPIQQVVSQYLKPHGWGVNSMFLVSLPIVVAFAYFSFVCIEKPSSKLLKRILKRMG